jgi:hypothetical protein
MAEHASCVLTLTREPSPHLLALIEAQNPDLRDGLTWEFHEVKHGFLDPEIHRYLIQHRLTAVWESCLDVDYASNYRVFRDGNYWNYQTQPYTRNLQIPLWKVDDPQFLADAKINQKILRSLCHA